MERIVRKIRVKNDLGLHTRPATMIVQSLRNSRSSVAFTYKKETVNAKSILSILMLAVQKNASLVITIEGEDAQETMDKLVAVFDNHFGENHDS